MDTSELDYKNLKKKGTGSQENNEDYKIKVYPFGKYEIKVKLTLKNEFIGITEVKINKKFLSLEKQIQTTGFHDVDKFYEDKE